MKNLGIILLSLVLGSIGSYLENKYVPLSWFDFGQSPSFGSTITTIQGTDTLTSSRSVINTNFSNLNTDKIQSGDTVSSLTITTGTVGTLTLTNPLTYANGGTGQTTYAKGDVVYASAANVLSKLGVGTSGQILAVSSGLPSWVATTTFSAGLTYANGNVTCSGCGASTSKWATSTAQTNIPSISTAGAIWVGFGTTSPRWAVNIASSSAQGVNFGQLALTDNNGGTNLKHWLFSSVGGNFYLGTTTDSLATSTQPALTIGNKGGIHGCYDVLTPGAQVSVNMSDCPFQSITLTANANITFTATTTATKVNVELCQDSTGSRTVTWGANMHWSGGSAPTLTTTGGKCDEIGLFTSTTTTFINGVSSPNF